MYDIIVVIIEILYLCYKLWKYYIHVSYIKLYIEWWWPLLSWMCMSFCGSNCVWWLPTGRYSLPGAVMLTHEDARQHVTHKL